MRLPELVGFFGRNAPAPEEAGAELQRGDGSFEFMTDGRQELGLQLIEAHFVEKFNEKEDGESEGGNKA